MKTDVSTLSQPPEPVAQNLRAKWPLDPDVAFLNHGSFGAAPIVVLNEQARLRDEVEREPVQFYERALWDRLDASLERIGAFIDAPANCLGFVTNATEGVHAAVRSTDLGPGDEIISTAHAYDAIANLLKYTSKRTGAVVHFIGVELPYDSEQIVRSIEEKISDRTRMIVVDHITSISGLIYPVQRIVELARSRGIDVCVDGAHAPGMLELSLQKLGPTYYTGNCHKWMCSPKGAGFLYVDPARREQVHPNVISNFYGRGFHDEFAWQGTRDVTPWLSVPAAIDFMERLGWDCVRRHNHEMMRWVRDMLAQAWEAEAIAPSESNGSMVTIPVPRGPLTEMDRYDVSRLVFERFNVESMYVDVNGRRMVRVSCQVYNTPGDYERLRDAVMELSGNG